MIGNIRKINLSFIMSCNTEVYPPRVSIDVGELSTTTEPVSSSFFLIVMHILKKIIHASLPLLTV